MPLIFAHRGARRYAPENSLPAFKKALELEVDGVEFDVQSTLDGVPVVVHDDNLKKLTGHHVHVHKTPYIDLQNFDIGSHHDIYYSGERIPSLREVLDILKGSKLILNIELKKQPHQSRAFLRNVIEEIERAGLAGRVIISSFSKGLLYKVGRMAPHLKRSLLVLPKAFFFLDILFFANILAVWGINPHTSLLNKWLMGYCRARGLNVFVWTANNVDDILKAEKLRVDALITDDPLLAAEVLREKGKMI